MKPSSIDDIGIVKKKAKAPTSKLTLALYRSQGYECAVTEHWNVFARIRQDLFGFCDIMAVGHDEVLFIQTTSKSNMSSRRKKILGNPVARLLMATPNVRVILGGWYKAGSRWQYAEESYSSEAGFICDKCATSAGGWWPSERLATLHMGLCPKCDTYQPLSKADLYAWPKESNN